MDAFPVEVHKKLKWYVYRLIDPRNGQTFYVGKGQGDRLFQHARGALKEDDQPFDAEMGLKTGTIRDIHSAGLSVVHVVHRHGIDSEDTAYEVEAALIDAFPGLTNLVGGHRSSLLGCRSVEEIVSAYKADPLVVKEPSILIFIGRALDEGRDVYDAVRGIWRMSKTEAEKRRLVLAYDGVLVCGAYRPARWLTGTKEHFPFLNKGDAKRIGFEGAPAENWGDYVGKRVPPRKKGAAGPFRYVDPGSSSH